MNRSDYEEAWLLVSGWRDPSARTTKLNLLRSSERRPYIAIAMIRIAAVLANSASVGDVLSEQLSGNPYAAIEEGILHLTDRILEGLDEEDLVAIEQILPSLADQELRAQSTAI